MAVETTSIRIKCDRCGVEAVGLKGHVGKYHKKCSGRKVTEGRKNAGKWVSN